MSSHPQTSIIVPVYNAERFIAQCIGSILRLNCRDWELILVDDGSSDRSAEIYRQWAENDERIRFLSKENGGVSSARNVGLDEAHGEWVTFLDADDTLKPDALETMTALTGEDDVDVVFAGYEVHDPTKPIKAPALRSAKLSATDLAMQLFRPTDYPYLGYPWAKLFRRKVITDNNLSFDEKIFYNEDRLFNFAFLSCCRGGAYTTAPVYDYVVHGGNAMAKINGPGFWKFETDLDAFVKMNRIMKDDATEELREAVYRGTYLSYRWNRRLNKQYGDNNKETSKRLKKKLLSVVPPFTVVGYQVADFKIKCKVKLYNLAVKLRLK